MKPILILATIFLPFSIFSEEAKPPAATDLYGDPLPKGAKARFGTVRLRQGGSPVFLPDGKTIATMTGSKLRLWDLATWKEIKSFKLSPPKHWANPLCFSADGRLVATSETEPRQNQNEEDEGEDEKKTDQPPPTIRVWEVTTGKELFHFTGNKEGVGEATFSPDGKLLAGISEEKTILAWDIATGKPVAQIRGHRGNVRQIAFGSDSKILLSASDDRTIRLWDVATGRELRKLRGHQQGVYLVATSGDGKLVASAGADNVIRLWDLATAKQLREIKGFTDSIASIALSPDGKWVAGLSSDVSNPIRLWDTATGQETKQLGDDNPNESNSRYLNYYGQANALNFSPNGKLLAVNFNAVFRLWEIESGKQILPAEGHDAAVESLAFSIDGKKLVSSGADHTTRLWDVETTKQLMKLQRTAKGDTAHAFSPAAKTLATAGKDNIIRLTSVATGESLGELKGSAQPSTAILFSPDGNTIAAGGMQRGWGNNASGLHLWELSTGKNLRTIPSGQYGICSAAFSANGKMIATVGYYQDPIHIWEVDTGKELVSIPIEYGYNADLTFSPDGRVLAFNNPNYNRLDLYEVLTGKQLLQLQDRYGNDAILAFSPDSQTIAMASRYQNEIHFYHLGSTFIRAKLSLHEGQSTALTYSQDGSRLAIGTSLGTILLCDVPPEVFRSDPINELSLQQLDEEWNELQSDDAVLAAEAVWKLAKHGDKAVSFLKEKLVPAVADSEKIRKFVADLDNADFVMRDLAQKELAKLGLAAESALREVMEKSESAEVRDRARKLLEPLDPPFKTFPCEPLRRLRSVQALEWNGSPAAREVLAELAKGPISMPLARDAKAALDRLSKQTPVK